MKRKLCWSLAGLGLLVSAFAAQAQADTVLFDDLGPPPIIYNPQAGYVLGDGGFADLAIRFTVTSTFFLGSIQLPVQYQNRPLNQPVVVQLYETLDPIAAGRPNGWQEALWLIPPDQVPPLGTCCPLVTLDSSNSFDHNDPLLTPRFFYWVWVSGNPGFTFDWNFNNQGVYGEGYFESDGPHLQYMQLPALRILGTTPEPPGFALFLSGLVAMFVAWLCARATHRRPLHR